MKKRQQISTCGTTLCITIPKKAVEAFHISTKRFFEWEKVRQEIIGTFCMSETVVTTRIQVGQNGRFQTEILHAFVTQYKLKPTKKGGPMAAFEWDENKLIIRISLES